MANDAAASRKIVVASASSCARWEGKESTGRACISGHINQKRLHFSQQNEAGSAHLAANYNGTPNKAIPVTKRERGWETADPFLSPHCRISTVQSAHLIIASGVLLSLKLGYLAAVAIYHLFAGVTSIGSFSSGFLTFTNITDKGRDLYAGITFSVASVCAFILVNEFMKWIERRTSEDVAISASRLIILANIPAAFAADCPVLS